MKKITWRQGLIVAAAVLLIAAAALILPRLLGGSDEEEIAGLQNGDFSLLDDDGNPLYWEKDGYGALSDVTFRVEKQEDGANIAHITSRTLHDARCAQQVKV